MPDNVLRIVGRLAVAALLSLPLHEARAQRDLTAMPIEQLLTLEVLGASRFPQRVAEAPSAVSIITAEDIRAYGYRTLADALRSVRGLHLTNDRNYSYLGVLGFGPTGDYNSRVQILVDGVRMNDNIYDQASLGSDFPLDLDLVERIEFVPGPSSSIYGANAILGVVNVVTKRGTDFGGGEALVALGSHGTHRARASWGRRLEGGAEVLVSFSGMGSRGADHRYDEFVPLGVADGTARGLDFERNRQLFARIAQGAWSAQFVHGERSKGIPTASFGVAPGVPGSQTTDQSTHINVGYAGELRPGLALSARVFYGRYRYSGDYVYDVPPLVTNRDQALGEWWGADASVIAAPWQGHKLVVGAEVQRNSRQEQRNFDLSPAASYLDDRRRGQRIGLYVQDDIPLRQDLRLNAGIRYDRASGRTGSLSPRLALIYNPWERTAVKLIHGTAFRPPNAYESFYASSGPGGQKANPDIGNERVRTDEAVLEHYFGTAFRVTGNLFRYTIHDRIESVLDPATGLSSFRNNGRVRSSGAGLELERRWTQGARLRASYSYQHTVDDAGNWLVNSPRRLLKLNAALPAGAGMLVGAEWQQTARRRSLAGEVAGFAVANVYLTAPLPAWGMEASVGLYNLFDKRYADPGGPEHVQDRIAQDGRTLGARLRLRF